MVIWWMNFAVRVMVNYGNDRTRTMRNHFENHRYIYIYMGKICLQITNEINDGCQMRILTNQHQGTSKTRHVGGIQEYSWACSKINFMAM